MNDNNETPAYAAGGYVNPGGPMPDYRMCAPVRIYDHGDHGSLTTLEACQRDGVCDRIWTKAEVEAFGRSEAAERILELAKTSATLTNEEEPT